MVNVERKCIPSPTVPMNTDQTSIKTKGIRTGCIKSSCIYVGDDLRGNSLLFSRLKYFHLISYLDREGGSNGILTQTG